MIKKYSLFFLIVLLISLSINGISAMELAPVEDEKKGTCSSSSFEDNAFHMLGYLIKMSCVHRKKNQKSWISETNLPSTP